jgi:hypothetical protein
LGINGSYLSFSEGIYPSGTIYNRIVFFYKGEKMKKLLLFIVISLLLTICYGQINTKGITYKDCVKIGNIILSDSLAKEYFADLYKYPDTIPNHPYIDGDDYNQRIKNAIGIYDTNYGSFTNIFKWIVPRRPSEDDFVKYLLRKKK